MMSAEPLLMFEVFLGVRWQSTLLLTFMLRLAGEGAVDMFLVMRGRVPVSEDVDLSVSLLMERFERDPVMMSEFRLDRAGLEIVL